MVPGVCVRTKERIKQNVSRNKDGNIQQREKFIAPTVVAAGGLLGMLQASLRCSSGVVDSPTDVSSGR